MIERIFKLMEEKILIEETGTEEKYKKYNKMFRMLLLCFIISGLVCAYAVYIWYSDATSYISIMLTVVLGIAMIFSLAMALFSKCKIAVTNYRVYGKNIAGQVDLPIDSISSVKKGPFKSIGVASSSGLVKFYLVESRDEIFEEISTLLKQRQSNKTKIKEETRNSTDELKKFKELLDMGIITQEEFDAKKKQLLNL